MKYVKWNFLTTENSGATHSNAFTVSRASVHLPIFLVEYRWLICCWKCSQIQADFCSNFFSSYLLDYPCMQQKVPVQPVIGYHRPMVGLLHIFNILVISNTKWKLWVFCMHLVTSWVLTVKFSGCTRPLTHYLPQEPLYA